jgi:hypothetical protein
VGAVGYRDRVVRLREDVARRMRGVSWSRIGRSVLRGAGLYLLGALVGAPAALGWAIANTHVDEEVGITPTTFTLTTSGHSELRLGIVGTVFLPQHRGRLGVVATVNGPADASMASADMASYVSPHMLELYAGLFHDPATSIDSYVELLRREFLHQVAVADLTLALLAGTGLLLVRRLWAADGPVVGGRPLRFGVVATLLLLASAGVGVVQVRQADPGSRPTGGRYDLPALDGTAVEGATTNSPILRLLLGDAVPKVHTLVQRQEKAVAAYFAKASRQLLDQQSQIAAPRANELAVLMQSDMHCNTTMIRLQKLVRTLLQGAFGDNVPVAMAISGDLTTNGTPAEGGCIRDEAAIAGGLPIVAVTGNHESDTSADQMQASGMTVLNGDRTQVGDLSFLGAGDPSRSELFGATRLRGTDTEADVGRRLSAAAQQNPPDLVLVHEAYAAATFVGVADMRAFLEGRGSANTPYDDGVRDVPASAVLYGHWHRDVDPRVVWNSDGTWTLVMELNTSGGAIATPTIGHFSTPWTKPQQEASFPVLYLDRESGLVTGYQIYRFATDGTTTVDPRVDVGNPAVTP